MKKITNPWRGMESYHCFGCDPDSKEGLRMEFYEDGDDIVSYWRPRAEFQGWVDTLHGGIQAALADEIASWVIFRKYQTSGVTSHMDIRYRKSISTNDSHIVLRAHATRERRNVIDIDITIHNTAGELCTEAHCVYFIFPKERAREEFKFLDCELTGDEVEKPL